MGAVKSFDHLAPLHGIRGAAAGTREHNTAVGIYVRVLYIIWFAVVCTRVGRLPSPGRETGPTDDDVIT